MASKKKAPIIEMHAEFTYRGRRVRVDNIVPHNHGGCDVVMKVVAE